MARVRITKAPKALSGLEVKMRDMKPGLYGTNGNRQFSLPTQIQSSRFSEPGVDVRNTLGPVDREDANLEAEKGETAVVNVDGMPAHFKIGGKRHSEGGTPLNLPDNSFIFSDTSKMKIKDLVIQAQFGMVPKKSGYTPAEISKKYDINKFRKVLADKNSESVERKTAEMMISNYNLKLAKLALIQESMKGFPQGIPLMAMPYIIENEMDASQFLPDQAQEQLEGEAQPDAETGEARYGGNIISQWDTHRFGGMPKAQEGFSTFREAFDKMPKTAVKITRPAAEKEDLIGKGFDNNPAEEKKWANDPEIGLLYDKYKKAIKSQHGPTMRKVAAELSSTDVGNWRSPSFAWSPNSSQNKLSDMAKILNEDADALLEKYYHPKKEKSKEDLDVEKRKEVADAFAYAVKMKDKLRKEGDIDSASFYNDVIKELHPLHPEYKEKEIFSKAKDEVPVDYEEPYKSSGHTPGQEAIYYNEKDAYKIKDALKKLYPLKDKVEEISNKKEEVKKEDVKTTPTSTIETVEVDEEF